MKDFQYYLDKNQEIGFVDQVSHSIISAHGLPHMHLGEVVIFESGELGTVMTIDPESFEVLLFSPTTVVPGTRIVRTGSGLRVSVNKSYLGRVITSAELEKNIFVSEEEDPNSQPIDESHIGFVDRKKIDEPIETGVTAVDLLVPIAKGQRQLVIGDRKTGKSKFLLQTITTQARKKKICIYAAIAKTQVEIQRIANFFHDNQLEQQTIIIASNSAHRAGLIYLTPYLAMSVAEYFRDQGEDVVIIFDDLTTHARYYREIMLLAKRFPGRSSYPGDIFYIHARLIERGGNFQKGSITCLPVAQSILGDLSGFIQTNLMAMTDGHIFFDSDLFDQGRRPAVNPFLSVTRVGEQGQTPLVREIGRELRKFLVHFEQVQQFKHFQTELSESIRETFEMNDRVSVLLTQGPEDTIPLDLNCLLVGLLFSDIWRHTPLAQMKQEAASLTKQYKEDPTFPEKVRNLLAQANTFTQLTQVIQSNIAVLQPFMNSDAPTATAAPAPTVAIPAEPATGTS